MHPCFIRKSVAAVEFIYSRREPKATPRRESVVFECIGSDTPIEEYTQEYEFNDVEMELELPLAEVHQQPPPPQQQQPVRARVIGPRRAVLFRPLRIANKKKYPAWKKFQLVPKVPRKTIPFTLPNPTKVNKAERFARRRRAAAPDAMEQAGRDWQNRYEKYAKQALVAYVKGNDPRKEGDDAAAPPAQTQQLTPKAAVKCSAISNATKTAEASEQSTECDSRSRIQPGPPLLGLCAQLAPLVMAPLNAHILSIVPEGSDEVSIIKEVSNQMDLQENKEDREATGKEKGPEDAPPQQEASTCNSSHTQAEPETREVKICLDDVPDVFMTDYLEETPEWVKRIWGCQDTAPDYLSYEHADIIGLDKGKGLVVYHNPFAGPIHRGPFSFTGANFDEVFDTIVREGEEAAQEREKEEFVIVQARKRNDDEHPIALSNPFAPNATWRIAQERDKDVKAALEEMKDEPGPSRRRNPFELPGRNEKGTTILLSVAAEKHESPPPPYARGQWPQNPFAVNALPKPANPLQRPHPFEKPAAALPFRPNPFQKAISDPPPIYTNPFGVAFPAQAAPAKPATENPFAKAIAGPVAKNPFIKTTPDPLPAPVIAAAPVQNSLGLAPRVQPEQPAPAGSANAVTDQKKDDGQDFHPFTGASLGPHSDKALKLAAVEEVEDPEANKPFNPFTWKGGSHVGTSRLMEHLDEALEDILRSNQEARRLRELQRDEPVYLDPNIDRARQFWQKKKEARAMDELDIEMKPELIQAAPRQRKQHGLGMGSELRAHIARECDALGLDQMPRRAGGLRIPRAIRGGNPMEVTLTSSEAWGKAPPALGNFRPGWELQRRGRNRQGSPRPGSPRPGSSRPGRSCI